MQMPPAPEVTAHHEAGHCIAALAVGARVTIVDMMAWPPYVDARWQRRHPPLDVAAFDLAGYTAEVVAGYERYAFTRLDLDDLGSDGRHCAQMITTHDLDVSDVVHRAAHLIGAHRQAVCDLADMLLRVEYAPGWVLSAWWADRIDRGADAAPQIAQRHIGTP